MVAAASRRDARERAVELLYEAETKGVLPSDVVGALPLQPDAYALELAYGVADHQIELDALLGRYAQRWPVARMAATDRTVLRLGAFELATQLDVPRGAVLSEAVELGSRYGSTDDTSRFVNGILAAVADEVRDGVRPWVPIDAVVFDMDGVIRHWLPEYLDEAEERLGLEGGSLAAVAFAEPDFRRAMTGELSVEEWAGRIGAQLAADQDVDADAVAEAWLASNWRIDEDVVDLVRGLREAGTPTALFSNASTKLEADLEEMGFGDLFTVVANSSRMGRTKPDVAAFDHVAELLVIDPARLLFVDDRPENVSGAVDAGWHAVQMRGADRLAAALRRLSVPGAPAAS